MDRCPANYSLLAWLPGDATSRISLVSAVKLLLLIVDQKQGGCLAPAMAAFSPNRTLMTNQLFFRGLGDGSLTEKPYNNAALKVSGPPYYATKTVVAEVVLGEGGGGCIRACWVYTDSSNLH